MVSVQGERVDELEEVLAGEVATAAVQRSRARLTRLGEEVHDRASEILADATMMIEGVTDIVQIPVQEENPEEDPEDEITPGSPTVD